MKVLVNLDELLAAFEWVSGGAAASMDAEAYVSRMDGKVYWVGEGMDEEPPADIGDGALYVAVPGSIEFDLGRSLVFRFVEQHVPDYADEVSGYFRKRGAYGRFKALLDRTGQLDAWHRYEQAAREAALTEWADDNGFSAVRERPES